MKSLKATVGIAVMASIVALLLTGLGSFQEVAACGAAPPTVQSNVTVFASGLNILGG